MEGVTTIVWIRDRRLIIDEMESTLDLLFNLLTRCSERVLWCGELYVALIVAVGYVNIVPDLGEYSINLQRLDTMIYNNNI